MFQIQKKKLLKNQKLKLKLNFSKTTQEKNQRALSLVFVVIYIDILKDIKLFRIISGSKLIAFKAWVA